jgi:hypothetical protein
MTSSKTFLRAFSLLTTDAKSAKKYLSDRRISSSERKIIEGYLYLRKSEFTLIEETLSPLVISDPIVNGIKELVRGIAKNNAGKSLEAILHLEVADELLKNCESQIIAFVATYNLFVAHHNLSSSEGMTKAFQESLKYEFPNESPFKIRQLRMEFNYWAFQGNDIKAMQVLKRLEPKEKLLDEFQQLAWTIDRIRFYARQEKYLLCVDELDKLKSIRSFYLTEDYKFIKATLGFLTKNNPLYLYDRDFQQIPSLHLQVRVLLALESQDLKLASSIWAELQKIAPFSYLDEFEYVGEPCLFSLCIKKFIRSFKTNAVKQNKDDMSFQTKEEKLFELLKLHASGISKSELFLKIWGTEVVSKDELKRLSKLLERVKLKYGIKVLSRKGAYILENNQQIKKLG